MRLALLQEDEEAEESVHAAATNGDIEMLKKLVEAKADVNEVRRQPLLFMWVVGWVKKGGRGFPCFIVFQEAKGLLLVCVSLYLPEKDGNVASLIMCRG